MTAVSPMEKQLLDGDVVRIRRVDVPPDQIPKYEGFEPGRQPRVQIRVGGQWHDGVVWHKIRYRDGCPCAGAPAYKDGCDVRRGCPGHLGCRSRSGQRRTSAAANRR